MGDVAGPRAVVRVDTARALCLQEPGRWAAASRATAWPLPRGLTVHSAFLEEQRQLAFRSSHWPPGLLQFLLTSCCGCFSLFLFGFFRCELDADSGFSSFSNVSVSGSCFCCAPRLAHAPATVHLVLVQVQSFLTPFDIPWTGCGFDGLLQFPSCRYFPLSLSRFVVQS